jgi:glycolate oxidase FAD binding subunit
MPRDVAGHLIAPADLAGLGAVVRDAAARRAPVVVRGSAGWWTDARADAELISTSALDAVSALDPADLVVTAEAGAPLDRLQSRLAASGVWLALDPPGPPSRTVGGILATSGAGPLASRYGGPRDQVLGLVVVAGDGTVLRLGGRVVKNVAGFDLAKLVVGGHGGFGVIAQAHLRVRALPRADRTAAWRGNAEWVARAAAAALAGGSDPAALEVLSPALTEALTGGPGARDEWSLAARALGAPTAVEEELDALARATGVRPDHALEGAGPWEAWRRAVGAWRVVLRIGAEPAAWPEALALARRHLGDIAGASITVLRGTVRVGTHRCAGELVRALRADAAARRWPVTLERADASTLHDAGVWGALPPRAAALAQGLKASFDPAGILAAPLFA